MYGKAGALLHSLVSHRALVADNERLGWQATVVFLWINGHDVQVPEDDAFALVMAVASGQVANVEKIAGAPREWSVPLVPVQRPGT